MALGSFALAADPCPTRMKFPPPPPPPINMNMGLCGCWCAMRCLVCFVSGVRGLVPIRRPAPRWRWHRPGARGHVVPGVRLAATTAMICRCACSAPHCSLVVVWLSASLCLSLGNIRKSAMFTRDPVSSVPPWTSTAVIVGVRVHARGNHYIALL